MEDTSKKNRDVAPHGSYEEARHYFLGLTKGWTPHYPPPVVKMHEGIRVVRDDLIIGTKARGADLLLHTIPEKTVVYAQARQGLAGVSLIDAATHYRKKVVLFMPASKEISLHQACCIERGAKAIFRRCASISNFARWGQDWADKHDACYVPMGAAHETVTAAIIHAASKIKPVPDEVWCVIATGVLARALQIAWPKAKFNCVAVGRALHDGEAGRARIIREPLKFLQREREVNLPPFPCACSYDAKAWKYIPKNTGRNILFWNVGTDPVLQDQSIITKTRSWVEWK